MKCTICGYIGIGVNFLKIEDKNHVCLGCFDELLEITDYHDPDGEWWKENSLLPLAKY